MFVRFSCCIFIRLRQRENHRHVSYFFVLDPCPYLNVKGGPSEIRRSFLLQLNTVSDPQELYITTDTPVLYLRHQSGEWSIQDVSTDETFAKVTDNANTPQNITATWKVVQSDGSFADDVGVRVECDSKTQSFLFYSLMK